MAPTVHATEIPIIPKRGNFCFAGTCLKDPMFFTVKFAIKHAAEHLITPSVSA